MLRSVVHGQFLLGSGLVLLVALSPPLQRKLNRRGLIPDLSSYGDLYHRTFLRHFKETDFISNTTLTEADKPTKRCQNVDLYTLGDSFTDIDTSFYAGRRNVHVWLTFDKATADLDRSRKNILVIEVLERLIQERLHVCPDSTLLIQQGLTAPDTAISRVAGFAPATRLSSWLSVRFGSDINYRIEMLFFNFKLFTWFKELRAQLLYDGFDRIPAGAVSRDHRHLFYDLETDTTFSTSAFRRLSASNTDSVVATINHTRKHYQRMGFDEVYFAFIPNKVTVIDPQWGLYNHQIERIQQHPALQAPLIPLYDTLTKHPDWYHYGDGHWNRQGKRYWLRVVNEKAGEWDTYGMDCTLQN